MLDCRVSLRRITDSDLECGLCRKCLGVSKFDYPFEKDLRNSDDLVQELIAYIEAYTPYVCKTTTVHKYPDINVFSDSDCTRLICRVEAKYLEGQAFMQAKQRIGLYPKETLIVDYPKFLSYMECKEQDRNSGMDIPIYIVWKFDRPCEDVGGIAIFQEIDVLYEIVREYGNGRAFQRRSSFNDYTDGARLGIVDKYHFSIRECEPIELLIDTIKRL